MNINIAINKKILNKRRVIVMSNHITNFDWIIIMRVLYELDLYDDCYFIMKESLSKIFFIGFCMKTFGFIFLKRNWAEDEGILKKQISSIINKDYAIIIFPEGTFLNKEAKEKLQGFLSKRKEGDIKNHPKYTLYPKSKGFNKIYELTKYNLDCIIDITLINNPQCEFPADCVSFMNVLFKKPGVLEISILLEYYGTSLIGDFVFECFNNKNSFIESLITPKYLILKKFSLEVIRNSENADYVFKTIFMIPNGVCMFFLSLILLFIFFLVKCIL